MVAPARVSQGRLRLWPRRWRCHPWWTRFRDQPGHPRTWRDGNPKCSLLCKTICWKSSWKSHPSCGSELAVRRWLGNSRLWSLTRRCIQERIPSRWENRSGQRSWVWSWSSRRSSGWRLAERKPTCSAWRSRRRRTWRCLQIWRCWVEESELLPLRCCKSDSHVFCWTFQQEAPILGNDADLLLQCSQDLSPDSGVQTFPSPDQQSGSEALSFQQLPAPGLSSSLSDLSSADRFWSGAEQVWSGNPSFQFPSFSSIRRNAVSGGRSENETNFVKNLIYLLIIIAKTIFFK